MSAKTPIEWFPDELVFIQKNFFKKTNKELLDHINSRRSDPIKLTTFFNQCRRMGLKRGIQIRWSNEDTEYLKRNYRRMGDYELARKLKNRYKTFRIIEGKKVFKQFSFKNVEKKRDLLGLKRTEEEVYKIRQRNIRLGIAFAFTKEHHMWNSGFREVAKEKDIRIWKDTSGNLKRVIKIKGRFIPYTRWFYQQEIGIIPKKHIVFHIDLDRLNDSHENLEVRKRAITSKSDYQRALPLISDRITEHLSAGNLINTSDREKLKEWHKELNRLKSIRKNILNKLKISSYGHTTNTQKFCA